MGRVITLDGNQDDIQALTAKLEETRILLDDSINVNKKILHQSRIHNMYKAHENDFSIDDNIFENDELD
jgi:hypothetical protein